MMTIIRWHDQTCADSADCLMEVQTLKDADKKVLPDLSADEEELQALKTGEELVLQALKTGY